MLEVIDIYVSRKEAEPANFDKYHNSILQMTRHWSYRMAVWHDKMYFTYRAQNHIPNVVTIHFILLRVANKRFPKE